MNIALQITANLSIVLQPFLPGTAAILSEHLDFHTANWETAGSADLLTSGHLTTKAPILFPKIEDELVANEVEKLQATLAVETVSEPQKDETSFDDFTKMDIRLGTILEAEKVKKADKLLKLLVDTGLDKRTIVSGIAKHYSPEEVIGKQVTVLMNLPPRTIRGVESQGMILMAENEKGELSFVASEKEFDAGSGIS
jgi:methionyl-tRNA synthetase